MYTSYNLNIINENLCDIKFNLFNCNCCSLEGFELLNKITYDLLEEAFCEENHDNCKCSKCIHLIDLLIVTVCDIEKCIYCDKNYAYLLQLDRFVCILKNLKRLLCQLKCLPSKDCEITSKLLCILYQVIELLENIVSKLNNIETLCNSSICCKCETLECMIYSLIENLNKLEENITNLAHLVLQLASLNVINCTSCTTMRSTTLKKHDYLKDYCDSYYQNYNCNSEVPYKYYK